jgi:Leucine-rich repeat (LRR) protein
MKKNTFILLLTLAISLMLTGGAFAGGNDFCKDVDLDGYGDSQDCVGEAEPGYVENNEDCDDEDSSINPGVLEICDDGIDNNCVNGTDEGCSGDNRQYWFVDADGDGYGDPTVWEYTNNPSPGYVTDSNDCNDQVAAINPGVSEICSLTDLTDENCSGTANDGCQTWWEDTDGDSYTTGNNVYDITGPTGYVLETSLVNISLLDCNDLDSTINPGEPEFGGDQIDHFPDPNLEACVLEQSPGGSYDPGVLANLTELYCAGRSISDLTGMQYLTGLTLIYMHQNQISDLTPLADLTGLAKLSLYKNQISDLDPLKDLTGLTFLHLYDNQISDSALASLFHSSELPNLTGLTYLSLDNNQISDLDPLKDLTELRNLGLRSNQISDLDPLAYLTKLITLALDNNQISDLAPLAYYYLPELTNLYLYNNCITDFTPVEHVPNIYGQDQQQQCLVTSAGQVWMDRNLGAAQVATSASDPAGYGGLYQWGRGTDGHQLRTSGTTSTLSTSDDPGHGDFITTIPYPYDWRSPQNDNLWQGLDGINNPCPAGFRLPTNLELETERVSWSSQDSAGAYASPLKLPMAGYRWRDDGRLVGDGTAGRYWGSTALLGQSIKWQIHDVSAGESYSHRAFGFSVRCIMD